MAIRVLPTPPVCVKAAAAAPAVLASSLGEDGEPHRALAPDLDELIGSEIASYNLFADMGFAEGLERSESRLLELLDAVGARMDVRPSPRSMTEFVTACRTLYALAHTHGRLTLKIACADKLLRGEGRWRWVTATANGSTNMVEAKEPDENVELLEGALARSKDLVRQLQAQCEAMRAEAKEKEAKRKASARKHKMEIADLRAQLSALQVWCDAAKRRPCARPHVGEDATALVSRREDMLCTLMSANCHWYVEQERQLRAQIHSLTNALRAARRHSMGVPGAGG